MKIVYPQPFVFIDTNKKTILQWKKIDYNEKTMEAKINLLCLPNDSKEKSDNKSLRKSAQNEQKQTREKNNNQNQRVKILKNTKEKCKNNLKWLKQCHEKEQTEK